MSTKQTQPETGDQHVENNQSGTGFVARFLNRFGAQAREPLAEDANAEPSSTIDFPNKWVQQFEDVANTIAGDLEQRDHFYNEGKIERMRGLPMGIENEMQREHAIRIVACFINIVQLGYDCVQASSTRGELRENLRADYQQIMEEATSVLMAYGNSNPCREALENIRKIFDELEATQFLREASNGQDEINDLKAVA